MARQAKPNAGVAVAVSDYADPKERILAAAFRVVARDAISGTRMPVIAKEAGLSQGALHYYWDSKENLLLGLLDWLLHAFRQGRGIVSGEVVPPVAGDDPARGVARQLAVVRMLITKETEMTRVYYDFWVQAAGERGQLQERVRRELGRYRGEIRRAMLHDAPPEEAEALAAVFLALLEGPLLQLALDDDAFDADEYLAIIERMMMAAIE